MSPSCAATPNSRVERRWEYRSPLASLKKEKQVFDQSKDGEGRVVVAGGSGSGNAWRPDVKTQLWR